MALFDAKMNWFDFRWNIKAGVKAGRLVDHGHYDLAMIDRLWDWTKKLGVNEVVLPHHVRTVMFKNPVRHGSYYTKQVWAAKLDKQFAAGGAKATTQPSGLDDAPARRETQSAWLERSLRSMMTRRINDKSIRVLAPLAHTLVILPCPCQHYTRA
jgi:hypothetical protein